MRFESESIGKEGGREEDAVVDPLFDDLKDVGEGAVVEEYNEASWEEDADDEAFEVLDDGKGDDEGIWVGPGCLKDSLDAFEMDAGVFGGKFEEGIIRWRVCSWTG